MTVSAEPRADQGSTDLHPRVRAFLAAPPHLFIDGAPRPAQGGHTFATTNPSTGETLTEVAEGRGADVDAAVAAARTAFEHGPWARATPAQREGVLLRLAALLERDAEVLAQLDSLDCGRPISLTSTRDLPSNARHLRYHAGWATKLQGATIPVSVPERLVYTVREPLGVCGAITPWNYPLNMAIWKVAPALAAGNTVVLKPAEQTPLSALYLAALAHEAGLPPGVLNVVPGLGAEAGAALAGHAGVDKIAFTGSTRVGREIARAAAGNLKRVSLELGGKSPHVIFADADLPRAAEAAAWGILANTGQNCVAGTRLFVQRGVYPEVLERVTAIMRAARVGPALDPATQVGPLVSAGHLARVQHFIREGVREGATLALGGPEPLGGPAGGHYLSPTVFTDVRDDMTVAREEIFGPVLSVFTFDDLDEVTRRANATPYGLAAAVWTGDVATAGRLARRVRAGVVWVNGYNLFDPAAPFGGTKQSGYGREMGEAVYELYTQVKTVWT